MVALLLLHHPRAVLAMGGVGADVRDDRVSDAGWGHDRSEWHVQERKG